MFTSNAANITVPGPIGSVLGPARSPAAHASLPWACSLCGSCDDVCPVEIPLHQQMLGWRAELYEGGHAPPGRRAALRLAGAIMRRPWLYRVAGRLMRLSGRWMPDALLRRIAGPWAQQSALPELPRESFRERYRHQEERGAGSR